MKKIILSISLLFVFYFADAQSKLSAEQIAVQETVTAMFQAIADRDIDKLRSYCSADIMLLENGAQWNLDSLLIRVEETKKKDFKRINSFNFIETNINKDIAWVTYNTQADIQKDEQRIRLIKWLETTILVKEKGTWKIRVLHSTLLK